MALVKRLVPDFDVVVENFRVGVMDRLGLSYETLAALNPRLVYAAIRGFGDPRTGASPYVDWPAYDVVAQAMGGMMGITGLAGGTPIKIGPGVGDTVPALYAALGIVSAVLHARETGEGQFLDVAMTDAVLGVCERIVHQHSFGHLTPGPEGNHHPFLLPFGVYPAADGFVALACPSDAFFRGLVRRAGRARTCSSDPELRHAARRAPANRERGDRAALGADRRPHQGRAAATAGRRRAVRPGDEHRRDRRATRTSRRAACWPRSSCQGLPEPMRIAGQPIKFARTPAGVRRRGPGPRRGHRRRAAPRTAPATTRSRAGGRPAPLRSETPMTHRPMRLRRSQLSVPGVSEKMIAKAVRFRRRPRLPRPGGRRRALGQGRRAQAPSSRR